MNGEEISHFNTLSSGELEFISLLTDLLTEPDVDIFLIDEVDLHYHPALQIQIINEIEELCKDRYVMITTHSPAIMLSIDPSHLFYMRHFSEVDSGSNQVSNLFEEIDLLDSISEMYVGFVNDLRLIDYYQISANRDLIRYASDCLQDPPTISGPDSRTSDPQACFLRGVLLSLPPNSNVIEIGAGRGRLLKSIQVLDTGVLSKMSYYAVEPDEHNRIELEKYSEDLEIRSALREFQIIESLPTDQDFDLCILSNVIHEIGPNMLPGFMNDAFKILKPDSIIMILESLELAVGEKKFTVFNEEGIRQIFKSSEREGYLQIKSAKPISYRQIPLLEMVIEVIEPEAIQISNEDVLLGLEAIISDMGEELAGNIESHNMSLLQFAFRCHNLSNAIAYKHLLSRGN